MRALLGNLALSITSVAICLAVGETVLRWSDLDQQLEFELDDDLYWRFRPNQNGFVWMGDASFRSPDGRINNIGTRGPDVLVRGAGKFRILMLGDSYTFGSGVRDEETFSAVLQAALGSDVEVINAGVPGYGIFQTERLLRRLGPVLVPQVVIVTIPTGDILRQPFDTPEHERAFMEAERVRKRLRSVSALATFVYRKYYAIRARFADEGVAVPNEQSAATAPRVAALWQRDEQRLAAMATLCRSWGGQLMVAVWPQKKQPEWDRMLRDAVRDLGARGEVMAVVDLAPALSTQSDDALCIPRDGHPSAAAHQVVGRHLVKAVQQFAGPLRTH